MNYKLIQNVKVAVTDNLPQTILSIIEEKNYQKPFIVMDSFLSSVTNYSKFTRTNAESMILSMLFMIKSYPIHQQKW